MEGRSGRDNDMRGPSSARWVAPGVRMTWLVLLYVIGLLLARHVGTIHAATQDEQISKFFHGHTNNWVVLVCTSRFWFNYRHIANTLSLYRTVKRFGIPDSQIILMLADDVACNPRNAFPATVFNNRDRALNLYGDNVEVDYRGYDVTVENFIRIMTDRLPPEVPKTKRLATDDKSNVLVYMTGHGGEGFLKFQDAEEISSHDVADTFQQMWEKKRYNEILFIIETCQANSMYSQLYSPNIIAVGSSRTGENSYSHHLDEKLGVAVIDRFTYYTLEFLEKIDKHQTTQPTLEDWFNIWQPRLIHSHPGVRKDLFNRDPKQVPLMDFFGNVHAIELSHASYPPRLPDAGQRSDRTARPHTGGTNASRVDATTRRQDRLMQHSLQAARDLYDAAKARLQNDPTLNAETPRTSPRASGSEAFAWMIQLLDDNSVPRRAIQVDDAFVWRLGAFVGAVAVSGFFA